MNNLRCFLVIVYFSVIFQLWLTVLLCVSFRCTAQCLDNQGLYEAVPRHFQSPPGTIHSDDNISDCLPCAVVPSRCIFFQLLPHFPFQWKTYNPAFSRLEIWFRFVFVVLTFIVTVSTTHLTDVAGPNKGKVSV